MERITLPLETFSRQFEWHSVEQKIAHLLVFLYWREHSWQRSVYAAALGFVQAASVTEVLHVHSSSLEESVTVSLKNERLNQLIRFFHLY